MCGRFRVTRKKEILEEAFAAVDEDESAWMPPFRERYNVAPGQQVAAVRQPALSKDASSPVRTLSPLRWGLLPPWSKQLSDGYKMINARAETAAERPSFRAAMRERRCLIPADGFYEWRTEGKTKLPFCFTMADESVFALAGLWERWRSPEGASIESCTILTTTPNELLRDVHDRMPVILPREHWELWLDPGFTRVSELQPMLAPYPAEQMRRYRVSPRVNQVKNDDAECSAPVEAA
jgi:putative SOS response-associated peptidase YedK